MSRILVIGSNAFSGASFVAHALGQGAEVIGTSRSPEPQSAFLPYRWLDAATQSRFTFHQLDLNADLARIIALIERERPDYVVNFAAQSMVAESWQNPGDWFQTNCVATIKLHDALRKCAFLRRYVHISTPEVYGSCSGFVDESFPFNPSTPYAVSRAAADMSLRSFRTAYNFPVVTTRAANVYGQGQQLYRIIPRTILFVLLGRRLQLHGGGVSTRSFIHIDDVSRATWQIMTDGRDGDTYHISGDEVISIRALVERICTKLDVRFDDCVDVAEERLGKDAAYHLSSKKLREELAWRDQVPFEQGLDDCIAWVKQYLPVLRETPLDYLHKP